MSPGVFASAGFMPETDVLTLVPELERLGFDGITLPDHLFVTADIDGRYPYSADGKPPFEMDTPWPDPLVLIAALGQVTTRLRFMISVQLIALRHPVVLAKAAATTARICNGRLSLGVGVGWLKDEFDVIGVDFHRRGAITDEAIDVMQKLWQPGVAAYDGRFFSFPSLRMEPDPPTIPIVIGGDSDAALRRAVRRGDGYLLPTRSLDGVPDTLARLRTVLDQHERDPDTLEIWVSALGASAEQISDLLDPMIDNVTVMPWPHPGKERTSMQEKLEHLERYASEVLNPLRKLAPA